MVTRSRTEVITAEYVPHLPSQVAEFIRADGLASWIWVLLWGKDAPIGIMGISSRESREYTSNDESLLVAIGRQLSTTVEKVRLYEETCRAYEDLRHTQEQLLQSEKMSAVGQLIAGVAHELNNPLTAILGYAQLLESEGLGERAADFVSKLFKQAQRTHRVVQNLLSFARQRKPQKEQVDICKVLDETLALRDYDLKVNDIKVEREIESTIPAVTADPHQLEQVFLNIINNGVDAMLDSGRVGTLKVRIHAEEGTVITEFQDSGPGIKEPNRIFDPFYTTKSVGKGTGLGLSICYGIIKEHGGDISARNLDAGGAVIEVRLPANGSAGVPEPALPASSRTSVIEGSVLLVEDEEAVLEFERDVLSGAGARVVTLMNGDEVKARLLQESFDAMIIDGKMANGWNAPDVYRWIVENRPGLEKHLMFTFSSAVEPEVRTFLHEQQRTVPGETLRSKRPDFPGSPPAAKNPSRSRRLIGENKSRSAAQRFFLNDLPNSRQRPFIPPIPHPKPKLLSLHQSRLGQNRHMMRNGRLGQVNALLDVRSAQAHILANRTSALFLEGLQDPPPGRIGHRVEDTVDFSFCHESSNKSRIDRCQYGTPGVRPRTSDQARK